VLIGHTQFTRKRERERDRTMYKRIPTQIAIAAFTKEETADEVVKKLVDAMADGKAVCTNLAIAKKNKDGKIKVKELGKPSLLKGMAAGTAAGAVVGSVVGGISLAFLGPVAVVGGAVGGIAGGAVGSINGAAIGTYVSPSSSTNCLPNSFIISHAPFYI
jgi:uncharacterized membrane protein